MKSGPSKIEAGQQPVATRPLDPEKPASTKPLSLFDVPPSTSLSAISPTGPEGNSKPLMEVEFDEQLDEAQGLEEVG